jgi:hypothetical protein
LDFRCNVTIDPPAGADWGGLCYGPDTEPQGAMGEAITAHAKRLADAARNARPPLGEPLDVFAWGYHLARIEMDTIDALAGRPAEELLGSDDDDAGSAGDLAVAALPGGQRLRASCD